MERALASLLTAACLLAGCGEPASELPAARSGGEAQPVDAVDLDTDLFSDVDLPVGEAPAADETGEALYRRLQCAGCHEVAARPGQPVRPLERLSERYSADTLAAFLAVPTPPMPVFDLDAGQRRRLAQYLLAAHP